jgi:hypothetical protein
MKRAVLFFAVACIISFKAAAQEKGFGLGVILGEPTGISAKYWVGTRNAVDGGLAWSFRHNGYFNVHADYLWHFPLKFEDVERLNFYVGIGGRLGFGSGSTVVGARIPVGLVYWPGGVPLDVFLEVAPILDLAPATEFTANGGVGVRFFF